MHNCTKAVNNVQPVRNSSHMAKILSVCNRLQAGDYENGNGGKRRVSRLTQFIHAMLQLQCPLNGDFMTKDSGKKVYFYKYNITIIQHLLHGHHKSGKETEKDYRVSAAALLYL